MQKGINRFVRWILVAWLSTTMMLFAEPWPQDPQEPAQTPPSQVPEDAQKPQRATASPNKSDSANAPGSAELPDAPSSAQQNPQAPPAQQTPPAQTQSGGSVPSGAAAAKAAPAKGAPASRPVGAAIAPAKQRERRSLLIKVGLLAGACVAVGSVVALSKASPGKPPGAP
jgi:cytoskeletal protein RodZ